VSYCLCSDIFFFGEIFFGEIFFGEILFDITCLPSLSFSTEKKSSLQPTRASVPRISSSKKPLGGFVPYGNGYSRGPLRKITQNSYKKYLKFQSKTSQVAPILSTE